MTTHISRDVIESFAQQILRNQEECEFHSFWIGVTVGGPIEAQEAVVLKAELKRRVGERVEAVAPHLNATPAGPDVRFILHHPEGRVVVIVQPLLVYGRYRKHSREIPQSRWPCRWCRGQGCEKCEGTGKRFDRTVEEILAQPVLAVSRAVRTKLHSIGREDVDARMLGRGRPFILECSSPRVRTFDLGAIQEEVNHACREECEFFELQLVKPDLRERMKEMNPDKSYRALVHCLVPARREAVAKLAGLRDVTLTQETPRRVLHRRPNRVRERVVRECAVEFLGASDPVEKFYLTLRTQSGAYIKEFISGDQGRTRPSVDQMLGVPCDCIELDVLEVHCDPLKE